MRRLFLLLPVLVLFAGCRDTGDLLRLEITGSSTLAPLIAEIAKRYEASHPDVRVDIQTGGSSRGIADAGSGVADIGMSSRALMESEKPGLETHIVAKDGVALLIHAENPIIELIDYEIIVIYTGRISKWSEVGGRDAEINCINRANGRSEIELFQAFFGIEPEAFQPDLISGENQHGIKTVTGDPNAIIYMSIGASVFLISQGSPIMLLPLRGVAASS